MKTWDDWSDFEINYRIAKRVITNGNVCIVKNFVTGRKFVYVGVEGEQTEVDYCNSWSNMGPIIVNNKIGVHPDAFKDGNWFAFDSYDMTMHESAEPLRAAAIVFLEMNGVNP